MVARSYFLSLLALATAFGSAIAVAAPQEDETAPPLNELESLPVDFETPSADARPVPGAESNSLLEVAPELGALANAVPNPEVTKRDVSNSFLVVVVRSHQKGRGEGTCDRQTLTMIICSIARRSAREAHRVQARRARRRLEVLRRQVLPALLPEPQAGVLPVSVIVPFSISSPPLILFVTSPIVAISSKVIS
jgi:hypothetical protein